MSYVPHPCRAYIYISEKWKWSCSLCQILCDPMDSPWNSPGWNTGVGSLSLLQWIFPTQGLNPGLLHCRWILYQLSNQGCPRILEWVAYSFSSRSSWSRNHIRVSCIAGRFFTNWATGEAQLYLKPSLSCLLRTTQTSFSVPQISQAHLCFSAFVLSVPSDWNILPPTFPTTGFFVQLR